MKGTRNLIRFVLAIMLLPIAVRVEAQPGKLFRVGFLDPSNASGMAVMVDALRQELGKLGWIEGQNITIEYRFADSTDDKRLKELAANLVHLKVDLIVATAPPAALAAKNSTATIPIVMTVSGDPVRAGLAASLAQPGGNVTGFTALGSELITKRLDVLKDAIPRVARVALLWMQPGQAPQRTELRRAALALKLKLEEIETQVEAKSLESAFQTAKQKQADAIMTTDIRSFFAARKRIVELAVKYKFPAIYFQKEFVDEGGLMSYGADLIDVYRRAATYVDKILKGAKPADLPVEQPTKYELVINLKTAKRIG
ncbi:MAG TPA: ABC transporter substrate-binding protein [Candidatus Binatia bacterium]